MQYQKPTENQTSKMYRKWDGVAEAENKVMESWMVQASLLVSFLSRVLLVYELKSHAMSPFISSWRFTTKKPNVERWVSFSSSHNAAYIRRAVFEISIWNRSCSTALCYMIMMHHDDLGFGGELEMRTYINIPKFVDSTFYFAHSHSFVSLVKIWK